MATVMKPSVEEPKSMLPTPHTAGSILGTDGHSLYMASKEVALPRVTELIEMCSCRKPERHPLPQCDNLWKVSI